MTIIIDKRFHIKKQNLQNGLDRIMKSKTYSHNKYEFEKYNVNSLRCIARYFSIKFIGCLDTTDENEYDFGDICDFDVAENNLTIYKPFSKDFFYFFTLLAPIVTPGSHIDFYCPDKGFTRWYFDGGPLIHEIEGQLDFKEKLPLSIWKREIVTGIETHSMKEAIKLFELIEELDRLKLVDKKEFSLMVRHNVLNYKEFEDSHGRDIWELVDYERITN